MHITPLLLVTLFVLSASTLWARPPKPPRGYVLLSRHHNIVVIAHPYPQFTAAYRVKNASIEGKFWEMPIWEQKAYLSFDGDYLAGVFCERELYSEYTPNDTMLSFYKHGQLKSKVLLSGIIQHLQKLRRPGSNVVWGKYLGFDENDRFQVVTVENRLLKFDPDTGKIVETEPFNFASSYDDGNG